MLNVSEVKVSGGELSEKEVGAYLSHIKEQYPDRDVAWLNLEVDGEFVNMSYELEPVPFERIRRITGYLVGTLDRFNNAKRAEEKDRVKHNI